MKLNRVALSLLSGVGSFKGTLFLVVALAFAGHLQADTEKLSLNIPNQKMGSALIELGRRAGVQIIFAGEATKRDSITSIQGSYTLDEALNEILKNSGLAYQYTSDSTVVVKDVKADASSSTVGSESDGQEKAKARVIEEVVVTATKRETSIQDTAMSITALGNEEIERRGLTDMGDYLNAVPGVSFMDQSAIQKQIVIRGLASFPQEEGYFGSLVGVYFGETPVQGLVANYNNPDVKLVDMERVEVLRGPQGTLYGSSNLGGTVRNIPKLPDLREFEGSLKAGYSNTTNLGGGNSDLQGVVNIPVIEDQIAVRAVAYRYENSGYYKNIGLDDSGIAASVTTYGALSTEKNDIGSDETTGGRIGALWQPTEKLSVNLTYLTQETVQEGWPSADLELSADSYLQARLGRQVEGTPGFYGNPSFDNEGFSNDTRIVNGTVEYDLGWASILSSTSWVNSDDASYREVGELFFGGVPFGQFIVFDTKAFVEELRFVSQHEGPLQYVLGFFYSDIEVASEYSYSYSGGDPVANPYGEPDLLHIRDKQATDQKAIFGEVSYDLSNKLKLTAGARFFNYDREYRVNNINGAFVVPGGSIEIVEADANDVSYKAAIDYTPNDDVLLYGAWSQGFRLGRALQSKLPDLCDADRNGIVDGSDGITTGPSQLDSDTVDSYELGGKFSFIDNRLTINSSIFQIDWEKIPVNAIFGTCFLQMNAGAARSRGIELEGSYNLDDSLLLNFGASYVKAELTNDAGILGGSGDRLPATPEYNYNVGLQYDFTLEDYESFVRIDYYYVGGFYNNLQETGLEIGDYGILKTRAGVTINNASVEIFADNITNEETLTWIDTQGGQIANRLRPRTIGMSIGYHFW